MKLLAATFLALASIAGPCAAGSTAYQIDTAHDGAFSFSGTFKPPLTRRWVRDLGGPVSYPIVVGGLVFVTAGDPDQNNADLYALNMSDGATVWSRKLSSQEMWANPAYDNNRIFTVDGSGTVTAFSADTSGTLLWSLPIGGFGIAPPLAAGGLVYVSLGEDLVALDETTGAKKWDATVNPAVSSPLTLGGGGLYFTMAGDYLRFDPATGAKVWDNVICCVGPGLFAVYHDGLLNVRDPHNSDVVLNAATGAFTVRWGRSISLRLFGTTPEAGIWNTRCSTARSTRSIPPRRTWHGVTKATGGSRARRSS